MEHETFLSLLHSAAHWEFEVFLTLLQDVLIGLLIWPALKRRFKKEHQRIDAEHGVIHGKWSRQHPQVFVVEDDGQLHD